MSDTSQVTSYLTGAGIAAGLALLWVAVQLAWRRAFPASGSDPDALAGRLGCHGCACAEPCARNAAGDADDEVDVGQDNEEGKR